MVFLFKMAGFWCITSILFRSQFMLVCNIQDQPLTLMLFKDLRLARSILLIKGISSQRLQDY